MQQRFTQESQATIDLFATGMTVSQASSKTERPTSQKELFSVNRNLLEEAGVEMPRVGTQTLGRASSAESSASNSDAEKLILVTTKTCPNCQAAKNYLNQAGIEYDEYLQMRQTALKSQFSIASLLLQH